jgi:DNA-binding response OmpR family regulator
MERDAHRHARILIIDDEALVADSLAMILSAHGYDIKAEYSAEAGVSPATAFRPDIVLADVMMPRMNGLEAAVHIQEELPHCRIVLISAVPYHAWRLQENRPKGTRAFEILAKPIDPRSLLASLRAAG